MTSQRVDEFDACWLHVKFEVPDGIHYPSLIVPEDKLRETL
jgi:hypothetical protein